MKYWINFYTVAINLNFPFPGDCLVSKSERGGKETLSQQTLIRGVHLGTSAHTLGVHQSKLTKLSLTAKGTDQPGLFLAISLQNLRLDLCFQANHFANGKKKNVKDQVAGTKEF